MEWAFDVLVLAVLVGGALGMECCPGSSLVSRHNCSDGSSPVRLSCTSVFRLLPRRRSDDVFTVDESGVLVVGLPSKAFTMDVGRFCVTTLNDTGEPLALACFPESDATHSVRFHVTGSCLLVSSGFLLLTLLVYALLPQLRGLEGACLVAYMISLCLGSLGLALIHLSLMGYGGCVVMAFFTYFWLLAAFFWLNVVAWHTWRSVRVRSAGLKPGQLLLVYSCYAWGIPLLFLLGAISTHLSPNVNLLRPNFGERGCWFGAPLETWVYFYGPVSVLLAANVLLFVWTAVILWNSNNDVGESRARKLRFRFLLNSRLFLLMGISWVFEVLSFITRSNSWFWTITDAVNIMQGFLIFLLLVVFRQKVRRLLFQKMTCLQKCFGNEITPTSDVLSSSIMDEVEMHPAS